MTVQFLPLDADTPSMSSPAEVRHIVKREAGVFSVAPGQAAPEAKRLGGVVALVRRLQSSPIVRFDIRLVLTIAVAFSLVGLIQYQFAQNDIERRLTEGQLDIHRSDARFIAERYESSATELGQTPLQEVNEVLRGIAIRPGTVVAYVVERTGRVLSAAGEGVIPGTLRRDLDDVRRVIDSGHVVWGRESDPGEDTNYFEYIVPVELSNRTLALEINVDLEVLDRQLADLRARTVRSVLIAILVGIPLFYLIGGQWLRTAHRRAIDRSNRDHLTGLNNRRSFRAELRLAFRHARNRNLDLVVVFVDIDNFKVVNDSFGHAAGDRVLEKFAETLSGGRAADEVFRIGGDEFAMLLPETDEQAAAIALERMRSEVEAVVLPITMSVGVAAVTGDVADIDELCERADIALYEAKRAGRNRVSRFSVVPDRRDSIPSAE
jgi:diguanylate cyclase (GGDEF)-like protein